MSKDQYWNGDEVITYSMANSHYRGWMFSSGRVGEYLRKEIFGGNLADTAKNAIGFVADIIINFKNAEYFSYPRPSETGWYSLAEVQGWFRVSAGERFNYASVYVNAMGDDANSFLYYMLVDTVRSVFIEISNTSWAGFIVNVIAMVLVLYTLYRTALEMGISQNVALVNVACYGISGACLFQVTELRAYMVASFFQMLLFNLHLKLYKAVNNQEKDRYNKMLYILAVIYVIGYVVHYTILFWAFVLGVNTVIILLIDKDIKDTTYLKRYFFQG